MESPQWTLADFVISGSATQLDALKKIDKNTRGFLIVLENDRVAGTLTDGDIRRALIAGVDLDAPVSRVYQLHFKYAFADEGLSGVIDKFKSHAILFLPIVDRNAKLITILTKKQFHVLMLLNEFSELSPDVLNVDELTLDYEICARPWGFYKTTVLNDFYQSKIITVLPQKTLSLQYHLQREEHWVIVHGKGIVQLDESILRAQPGDTFFIPKKCLHRVTNASETETLIISEVQRGTYFGEDDIIRMADDYGRA